MTKTARQHIKQQLLSSNNGFLPGFLSFSLLAKLLKCALKWPLRAASEGQNQDGRPALKYESIWTENDIFVNHLSRPFI